MKLLNIPERIRPMVELLVDLVYPPRCPVCDGLLAAEEKPVHKNCVKKLYFVKEPACMHCGRPVAKERIEYCPQCKKNPPVYKQGRAVFEYRGAIRESMYRFKYQNRREYASFYAECAVMSCTSFIRNRKIDVIVPVPMYRGKKRVRGYNQAQCLAEEIACRTGIPLNDRLICRRKNTKPLKLLDAQERRTVLENAFEVSPEVREYRNILVVDDIVTTGATISEMAKAMKAKNQAVNVYALTICGPRKD